MSLYLINGYCWALTRAAIVRLLEYAGSSENTSSTTYMEKIVGLYTTNHNINMCNKLTTPKLNTSTFEEISPRAHSGA